jgi:hypothetical protein
MTSPCAALLVFDLLMLDGHELLELPLGDRRHQLESLMPDLHPCLQLVEQTENIELARDWLADLPSLEGLSPNESMDGTAQATAVGSRSSVSARPIASWSGSLVTHERRRWCWP